MHAPRQHAVTTIGLVCALVALALPVYAVGAPTASTAQQTATARAKLGAMRSEMGASMSAYDAAATRLASTRAQISSNRHELDALKTKIASGQRRLNVEANFLYRTDGNGFTEALLSSTSFDEFANRLVSLARVTSRDAELLGSVRTDRVAATQLASQLSERERSQAALLAQVSARRAKAQAALNAQQAYTDSLAPKVAKALDAEQKSSNDGGTTPPPPPATDSHAVTSATVQGRSGSYAVIVGQPKSYHPSGLKFDGLATWYGNVRPNMHTSSGRAFDERDFTCAHKSLPFGTRIAVTFRGHRVIVTVTDRGPYGKGRVIDLTKHAAAVIGLKSAGVGSVQCEVVSPD